MSESNLLSEVLENTTDLLYLVLELDLLNILQNYVEDV